jgi:hypothetical protein
VQLFSVFSVDLKAQNGSRLGFSLNVHRRETWGAPKASLLDEYFLRASHQRSQPHA